MALPIPGVNGVPANPNGVPNIHTNTTIGRKGKGIVGSILDAMTNVNGSLLGLTQNNDPTSLAQLLERQAANQDQQVQSSDLVSTDPFTALQNQLFSAANSINVPATPLEQLRRMADAQVSAQYDPQIEALGGQINAHTNRAHRSEKDAKAMYGALAKDYLAQLPDITAQYKAEDDATNQRYADAQNAQQQNYDKNAQQQDALLKQLGIQGAAPDASQQARDDQAYFQGQSKLEQNSALDQLAAQQGAQTDYTRNLSGNAQMAGTNAAQDIENALQDYRTQADSQLTALSSGKQSAIAALLQQLQAQDAQRVQQQTQQQFGNMMDLYNFQLAAQKAAGSSANQSGFGQGAGAGSLTSGIPGAQNYLANQYPNQPILASSLMGMINDVISNPDVAKGKFIMTPESGTPGMPNYQAPKYSDVGQQYMENLLRQEFAGKGKQYSTGDINATIAALEAYLGKLR